MKLNLFDCLDLSQLLDEKIEDLKLAAKMGVNLNYCGEEIGKYERLRVLVQELMTEA